MSDAIPEYCSAETIARELDCSASTVHAYVKRGILPQPVKRGALGRWKWSEVERWMQSSPNAEPLDPIMEAARGS